MKIFVFSTHAGWQPHLETELEIIQRHLEAGDEVYRFVCNGDFPICDMNQEHVFKTCLHCRDMSSCGKSLLKGNINDLPIIYPGINGKNKLKNLNLEPRNQEELSSIEIDNFDLGIAVLSSLISWYREPVLDLSKYTEAIKLGLQSAAEVYFSAIEYIKTYRPDKVYCFNGRLMHGRAILRASSFCNTDCYVHERGNNKNFYALYKNTTPHDRFYTHNLMYELWNQADTKEREEIGRQFYEERAAGKSQSWYSYTAEQKKGMLPDNWDSSKRNIVIFNSSEDEFAAIGNAWKNELYTSQLEAIPTIVKDCAEDKELHFYLRVHPNLIGVDNSETRAIAALNYSNLTVIEANSPISTYDLVFNAEKVITFGSSVGIEAVYWDKPSIQAGKSYYFEMDATYKPKTHEETVSLIKAELPPLDKTPALVYGHYFKTYGIPYSYYEAETLATGKFKGVNIFKEAANIHSKYKNLSRFHLLKVPIHLLGKYYQYSRRNLFNFVLNPDQKLK